MPPGQHIYVVGNTLVVSTRHLSEEALRWGFENNDYELGFYTPKQLKLRPEVLRQPYGTLIDPSSWRLQNKQNPPIIPEIS